MSAGIARTLAGVVSSALLVVGASTCSLGNIAVDDCAGDAECTGLFGLGSRCLEGACTAAAECTTSAQCQAEMGYGTRCQAGVCAATPLDGRCRIVGPEAVVAALGAAQGTKDAVLVGAIFDLGQQKEQARAAAVELAVEDMNAQGGTKPLAVAVCNNTASGALGESVDLARYLAGDMGAPAIIGPSTTQAVSDVATALYEADSIGATIVTPAATGLQLTDQPDSVGGSPGLLYRTCLDDGIQAAALAARMLPDPDDMEVTPGGFVVFYPSDQYGSSYQTVLSAALGASGRPVIAIELDGTVAGVPAGVAAARQRVNDDMVTVLGVAVVSARIDLTLAILEEAGTKAPFLATDFFLTDGSKDKDLATIANMPTKTVLERTLGVAPKDTTDAGFLDRIEQRTSFDPSQYSFVSNAYDAAFVVGFGVAYANLGGPIDGAAIATGIGKLSSGDAVKVGTVEFKKGISFLADPAKGTINLQGLSGGIDFDPKGDVIGGTADMEFWCVRDGRITTTCT